MIWSEGIIPGAEGEEDEGRLRLAVMIGIFGKTRETTSKNQESEESGNAPCIL